MLAKSVETVLKLSDFYTITAVRWQYTPHIHALYISSKRYISGWLILDSRVVMGQFWRHRLFLQAFHEGRDRGGIFGKSLFIANAYVLYRVWKTPKSNKSHGGMLDGLSR